MDVSLGFIVALSLVLFPGLLFRRLYFYGEFSKQFSSGHNLIWLIAVSTIPGILILLSVYWFYNKFITEIDLEGIIDTFKDINNPNSRNDPDSNLLRKLLSDKVFPFIGFLYLISFILGAISGRFIRISGIDTRLKLFRFKNYWFYLFNGHHTGFKKMKHLKQKNKRHLFTKADILIDANNEPRLYSGIIVDYELNIDDCTILSKIMLQNAERYGSKEGKRVPVSIPGQLLVIDCTSMKNINLTYVYEDLSGEPRGIFKGIKSVKEFFINVGHFFKNLLSTKVPNIVDVIFTLIILLLIPFFIFQSDSIEWQFYKYYFSLTWYSKIVAYFLIAQIIILINPFIKIDDQYRYVDFITLLTKIAVIAIIAGLLWLLI